MRHRLKSLRTGWGFEDRFFTEWRLRVCASTAAVSYAIGLVWLLGRHEWIDREGRPCTDFTWIWLSSKFGLTGSLAQAYDFSTFSAARDLLIGPPNCLLEHLDYPPTLLFFTFPLGLLPYAIAFAIWLLATLLLYVSAVYAALSRVTAVIAALTLFPVVINVLLGHNGFLTAGLMGFTLALVKQRPVLAGIFLGLLTYKPQFGILFPIALLASGNWRVLLSATASTAILISAAVIAFGYQAWPAFIDALVERASALSADPELNMPLVSIFPSLRFLGLSAHAAWTAQLGVTAVVGGTVCALWGRSVPYSLKAAALAIGSLLAAPHVHGYDVCILSVGVVFLVKDGLERGFLPGERTVMLMCWAGLILLAGPIPDMICVVLLVLVIRRAVRCQGGAVAAPRPVLQSPL